MISVALLIILTVFLIYRYLCHHYAIFKRDGVPGPTPSFFIGNLAEFKNKDALKTFYDLTKRYGKVFGFFDGFTPSIVVSDPAMIELILVKNFQQFNTRPATLPFTQGAEALSLMAQSGPAWKRSRCIAVSGLRTACVRKMWPRLQRAVVNYMESLNQLTSDNPEGFNISDLNEDYAVWSFTTAIFNMDREAFTAEDANTLLHYVQNHQTTSSPRNRVCILKRLFPFLSPFLRLFDVVHKQKATQFFEFLSRLFYTEQIKMEESKESTNFVQQYLVTRTTHRDVSSIRATTTTINNTRTVSNNTKDYYNSNTAKNTAITTTNNNTTTANNNSTTTTTATTTNTSNSTTPTVTTTSNANDSRRTGKASTTTTEAVMLGVLSSMFGGGLGPTATTVDFVLYCLALYPEEQEKLRQEVMQVCGDQELLEMEHLQSMEYLDMLISETLRLYPVAPGVARTCVEDCVVGGVKFRKGVVVRLMGSTQYQDPQVFDEPERFMPERFSKEERSKRHPHSFIPFGSGPRVCVAKRLGTQLAKLVLASVVRRYTVRTCARTQTPLPLTFRPFLRPLDGVYIRLVPRDESG